MDESAITVIAGAITSAIAACVAKHMKSQQSALNEISEQSVIMEKESAIMQKIVMKEKEREAIMREVHILMLDTNLHILANTRIAGAQTPDDEVYEKNKRLKESFVANGHVLDDLTKEFQMVRELQRELKNER